ncbi:hypothetical protein ACLKA7_010308 [Drosophila subpalustris]
MLSVFPQQSSTEDSLNNDYKDDEANLDTRLEAAVRWIIYIFTYALAIIGQCVILMGLVLDESLGHISPDKLGFHIKSIIYLFVLSGVVTIIIAIAGGGWFNAHQSLLLRFAISFRSTEYKTNRYLTNCWNDFTQLNKTMDMMELQIRFECCGRNGIKDYARTDYVLRMSCHKDFNMQADVFPNNCSHALKAFGAKKRIICIIVNSTITAFMVLGITSIMTGFYLPINNAYMQIDLLCCYSLVIRKLFIITGGTMILAGAMTAFWYRGHNDIFYALYIILLLLLVIFTISLAISISHNCDADKAVDQIEKIWLNTEYNDNAFFMMQQYLECCGKTGESDYVEKEEFPVCHKNFNEEDIKFTKGCIDAERS